MPRTTKSRMAGIATGVTLALVAGYVVVSGSFTFPSVPTNAAVADGFSPYFSQRWDVFAPNLLRTNSALQIQVQWRGDDDELVKSDWVDVTGMELEAIDYDPVPSRISKNTVNAAVTYLGRYDDLSDEQKSRVEDTFIERTDDGGFQPIPDEQLVSEIEDLGDDDGAVVRFVRYDYMLTRFAATFGQAYFGHDVERVRWRVQFDRPNDFDQRHDDDRQTPVSDLEFGWRQPAEAPDPDRVAIFADVIERYDR